MDTNTRLMEFMDKDFDRVNVNDSLSKAVKILMEKSLIGLLVIDDEGNLVGSLTERECLRVMVHQAYHTLPVGRVGDYMEMDYLPISSKTTIKELCDLFRQKKYRRYPVVDDGKLVGQITRRDLLRTLHNGLYSV